MKENHRNLNKSPVHEQNNVSAKGIMSCRSKSQINVYLSNVTSKRIFVLTLTVFLIDHKCIKNIDTAEILLKYYILFIYYK